MYSEDDIEKFEDVGFTDFDKYDLHTDKCLNLEEDVVLQRLRRLYPVAVGKWYLKKKKKKRRIRRKDAEKEEETSCSDV